MSQIHQWATNEKIKKFLREKFQIEKVPCYHWLLYLLKIAKPDLLKKCFIKWVKSRIPDKSKEYTVAVDGKTIRSTTKMSSCKNPLHIISAYISELGMTLTQKSVSDKSNEIPAVQELLNDLNIKDCLIVADALNCQKETAKIVIEGKGDYLLCVKDNQPNLKKNIEDYVKDDELLKSMNKSSTIEKNRGRIEKRTAYITNDIKWLDNRKDWKGLVSIGAIYTEFKSKKGDTSEWHYYITSRDMTAEELLFNARKEWSVETMHWLLDVNFDEDFCRVEDKNVQQNLNMLRKLALNIIKQYKVDIKSKRAISKIMLDCLLDCTSLLKVINEN